MKYPIVIAQQLPARQSLQNQVVQASGHDTGVRELSRSEFSLSIAVLAFTLILVTLIALIAIKKGQGFGPTTTKLFVIVVVVGAALFLLTAGYSNDQMTPIIGLLGTIVGYSLGKTDTEKV
jgi:hypothetical protein